jgi:hypothetical protein
LGDGAKPFLRFAIDFQAQGFFRSCDTIEALADKGYFNATLLHWNHDTLLPLRRATPGSKEGLPALPPDNVRFPTTASWAFVEFPTKRASILSFLSIKQWLT